ncbi:hypothetical protein SLEP1_g8982 [Rubroshorea leprosula]|uniref:Uncharacterized protein n=1 Tax=Rubroshorea leprosula TaxID=152421 RepID=A0AAV5IEG8_9ROSI|nr:hypothetical protein SLEP1_g8982 [Rubroshorea leprosula]
MLLSCLFQVEVKGKEVECNTSLGRLGQQLKLEKAQNRGAREMKDMKMGSKFLGRRREPQTNRKIKSTV